MSDIYISVLLSIINFLLLGTHIYIVDATFGSTFMDFKY